MSEHRITHLGPLASAFQHGQLAESDPGRGRAPSERSLVRDRGEVGAVTGFGARLLAPPHVLRSGEGSQGGSRGLAVSDKGAQRAGGVQLRRSGVASLPVSGHGSMAAGVATSVAGDVAREAVESALTERFDRSSTGGEPSVGLGRSVAAEGFARTQRSIDDTAEATPPTDMEAQKDELLRFTMSDAFEERLMEFLEDRLLGEIERRGGRYGGGFA